MTTKHTPITSRLWMTSAAALALAWSLAPGPADVAPLDDTGRETFIAKGCAGCHAIYGYGPGGETPRGGPDLGEKRVYGTRLQFAANLWNHLPDMLERIAREGQEPAEFSADDVDAIIRYLSFLRYMDEPGNVRAGRRLLRRKQCTTCHRFGGEGGDVGPDLTEGDTYIAPLDLATALWNHGPDMNADFEAMDIDRPDFGRNDIRDIAAAIRSFIRTSFVPAGAFEPGDPESGRALLVDRHCTRCHAVGGPGADLAPDFADLDFDRSVTEIAGAMWNHGPDMWDIMDEHNIPFPELSRRDMADIIAFLYSIHLDDPEGDAGKGGRLLEDKHCTACHSAGGSGGSVASDLHDFASLESSSGLVAAMWSHAPEMADYAREQRVKWPSLSGADIRDIYAYLRSR